MNYAVTRGAGVLASVFFSAILFAQGITGAWQGSLHVEPKDIPIVFHIARDGSGKLVASFDSPSQNAFNLAVSEVITKEDSVILLIAMLNGKFAGILGADRNNIDGRWWQGGGSLPLKIVRISDSATVKQQVRPQTPKPPFDYATRDVEYWNADKTIRYGGTISYPSGDPGGQGKKGFPAVVLITGSGQQDRDETLYGHKPFAVLADNLTRQGFCVLRVDDRGMGKTTGDFGKANSLDFVKDVEAGLDFLSTQPEADKDKMGLLGHSEGGMIAPIVANERKEVKFVILLAAPGIPIMDLMQQQAEAVSISQGRGAEEARAGAMLVRIVMEEINKGRDTARTFQNIRARVGDWMRTIDTATRAKIRSRNTASVDDQIRGAMATMGGEWFRYFLAFDPRPYLQRLHCKVLALNGSKDVQIISASNLEGIRACLKSSQSPAYEVIEVPGLNHLFQTCVTCSPAEYSVLEETFSPAAMTIMDDWLVKNVR